jgi:hypothetical protein
LLADFLGEIFLLLFDACADFEAHHRQHFTARLLEVLLHRLIRILDEGLAEQRDLAKPLAQLALDSLGNDLRCLTS